MTDIEKKKKKESICRNGALGWIRTNDHPIRLERMGSHHCLMGPSIKGLPTILLLYYSQDKSGAQTN